MTQMMRVKVKASNPPTQVSQDSELAVQISELNNLLKRHIFGSHEHLQVISKLSRAIRGFQNEGIVSSFELGTLTHNSINVHIFVPLAQFTLEQRQRIRLELRAIGQEYDLYVDSHIQPDSDCGETE